jgi:dienelactone hydrolase
MMPVAFEIPGVLGPVRGDARTPRGEGPFPVVVMLHGFKGFKDFAFFPAMGESLASAGIASIAFNFSGNGIGGDPTRFSELDKFAENSVTKMLEDLERVLRALESGAIGVPGADLARLGLFGHSLGGGMAILTAARDPRVRAVATWGSVSRVDRFGDEEMRLWKERGYHEVVNKRTGQAFRMGRGWYEDLTHHRGGALDVTAAARRLRAPILLVHGSDDESVPVEEAHEIERAALDSESGRSGRVETMIIAGGSHTLGAVHPLLETTPELERAQARTRDFFVATLR